MIFKGSATADRTRTMACLTGSGRRSRPARSRLDELVTTTTVLALDRLLSEDSTFYGDLFPHAVKWKGIVLPRGRVAPRCAGGAAQPRGAARAGVRHGHAGREARLKRVDTVRRPGQRV